jgi:predicted HD phosphohydrolase
MTDGELRDLLEGLAGLPYGGEPVDQLAHALQAAGQALAEEADDELVIAALLHDVGRARSVLDRYPEMGHDAAGELFLRDELGERVAWLVGQHAEAKRYLVTTDPAYFARLTGPSVASLAVQGGPMTDAEVDQFRRHPWWKDAVRLRSWDDEAKIPDAPVPAIDTLLPIHARVRATHAG